MRRQVRPSRSHWKPFLAVLAAMEGYLMAGSLALLAMDWIAPDLDEGLPATDVGFHLLLHGYGICLASGAMGVYLLVRMATSSRRPPPPSVG
jgi:hypothetical protein